MHYRLRDAASLDEDACVIRSAVERDPRTARNVRDEIVRATERHGLDALASIDRDDEGDTIYAIDVIGETIVARFADDPRARSAFVMVAEGLPEAAMCYPEGIDEARRRLLGSSSTRSTGPAA